MAYESCLSNYMNLAGYFFFLVFMTRYMTLERTSLYFCLSGSIKWAQYCVAEDNDYTLSDNSYHMVRYMRLGHSDTLFWRVRRN